jgi:hypothetical protein
VYAVASSSTRPIAPPSAVIEKLESPGAVPTRSTTSSSASGRTSFAFWLLMNDRLPQANARSWAVWTSRYGALPTVVVSCRGVCAAPQCRARAASAEPLWFQAM